MNGQPSNVSWIRFANVINGGTLAFNMGTTANTNWGSNLLLAPPSYMDGMTTTLAQNYVWGTGLESGEPVLSATNTVDSVFPAGGISSVGAYSGAAVPELGVRNETSQSGSGEIMYSGNAQGGASVHAYMKAFDLTGQGLVVSSGMHLSYWVYPQSSAGPNSAYVAMDIIFTDGTTLRSSGLKDQYGYGINPTSQGGRLVLDTWNYVTVDLTPLLGKAVSRIDFGFDRPNSTGLYRGYVDDISLSTPINWFATNLATNQPATTDSQQAGNPASSANDGNTQTYWSANDGYTNHWWQVDLGAVASLTADEIVWPTNGLVYGYTVAASLDNVNWMTVANKTLNTSTAQIQSDVFLAIPSRYVRITVTSLPPGKSASINEFRVLGTLVTQPSAPVNLQAFTGYGLVGLSWSEAAGATSYNIKRSTNSGAETTIGSATSTNYADRGLVNGMTYYYVVSPQNIAGQGGNSSEVSGSPEAPVPGSYAALVVTNHPLAYWPLEETNGLIAYDMVGGYNGTYVGGVALGQPGVPTVGFLYPRYAALFDGTSDYVSIPGSPFNITNAITMVTWVNVPVTPHFSGIIGRGDSSWRMTVNGSGQPGAADGGSGDATSSTSIVGSGWHMVAYAYTGIGGANNGSLYVDGVLKANNTVPSPTGNGSDIWIGGAPDYGTGRLLPASIAQVAVFTNGLGPYKCWHS